MSGETNTQDTVSCAPREFWGGEPTLPLTAYDGVEVDPIDAWVDEDGVEQCERMDRDDLSKGTPAFWSVYLHLKGGTTECVADCPTEGEARRVAAAFEARLIAVNGKLA